MSMGENGLLEAWRFLLALALFLYGWEKTTEALRDRYGERIRERISRLTDNARQGVAAGMAATALLWSPRATFDITAGLTAGRLLAWRQGFLSLLGSEIGACLPALLLALPIPPHAGLLLVPGLALMHGARKTLGHALIGLGLLVAGQEMLGTLLQSFPIQPVTPPVWLALPVGALASLVTGSPIAALGVLCLLAAQGGVSQATGLALLFGINLGAALSLLLAARKEPGATLRLAIAATVAKLLGVAICWWIPLPDPSAPAHPLLLVTGHLLINVIAALTCIPGIAPVTRLATRLAPEEFSAEHADTDVNNRYWPQYLDDDLLATPPLALAMARREVKILAALLAEMVRLIPDALFAEEDHTSIQLLKMDDRVDEIHLAISRYLARIVTSNPAQLDEWLTTMTVINELEAIGDIIENNLLHLAETQGRQRTQLPPEIRVALGEYLHAVRSALDRAANAYQANNPPLALEVMAMKNDIVALDSRCRMREMQALRAEDESLAAYAFRIDLCENFKRIYYHAKRIAKAVAKA
ncbi:MAG: Na/Pi cotransporter family protein [Magnetococcales bacterium]|nr:Na/Pi cotransporter family protein [Magnetococcales bacterium]